METLIQQEYRGMLTRRYAEKIPLGYATVSMNGDLSSSTEAKPEKGYSNFAHQSNASDKTTRRFTYERGNGYETQLQVRDDGTNSYLEILHPGDTRESVDGEWLILVTGLTTGKIMGFTPFNDTGTDNLLFCNGVDNFSRWSGAICVADGAITAGATTISVKKVTGDPKTNATDGFPASGSFVYRNTAGTYTTVTYTGKTASSFTGCSGATVSADNTGIMQAADTTTYSAVNKNNILITHEGRVKATGNPAQPTVVDMSAVSDFTDWTPAVNPDDPASRDFPEGGKNTALAAQDDWLFVGKEKGIYAYKIVYQSATTRSEAVKRISGIGISNQKAVCLAGNEWFFASPQGRLGRILRLDSESVFAAEDLTAMIEPTLEDYVWDDASLEYWDRKHRIMAAVKKDSDSAENDRVIVIQLSLNENNESIINYGLLDWFVSDWTIYNDQLYHGSGAESICLKSFDGYSKNGATYDWYRTDRVENFGEPTEKKYVQYHEIVGMIARGTILEILYDYDENGHIGRIEKKFNGGAEGGFIVEKPLNPLGATELGMNPLGGSTLDDIDGLNFFHVFIPLPNEYRPYNIQRTFHTSGEGQRVAIFRDGFHFDYEDEDIPENLIYNP